MSIFDPMPLEPECPPSWHISAMWIYNKRSMPKYRQEMLDWEERRKVIQPPKLSLMADYSALEASFAEWMGNYKPSYLQTTPGAYSYKGIVASDGHKLATWATNAVDQMKPPEDPWVYQKQQVGGYAVLSDTAKPS